VRKECLQLKQWLKAEYYTTNFRPIELTEMIKINETLFDRDLKPIKIIQEQWKDFFPQDSDQICELVMETLLENCQLVIFCPTKDWCEQLCTNLARGFHNIIKNKSGVLENIIDKSKLKIFLEQMKNLPFGVDQTLQRSLAYACAYHHAGITTDERDFVEMGFKDGTLKVLVATTTLSSGVNLPARRVIIRTPMFGKKVMSNLSYRQMIGRAGRKGKDTLGESILICSQETSSSGKSLLNLPLQTLSSALESDNYSHFKRALLEVIASGVASTMEDLECFINSTLFCQQHGIVFNYSELKNDELNISQQETSNHEVKLKFAQESKEFQDQIKASIDFLLEFEFIRHFQDTKEDQLRFVPTRLGLACLSSSISPKEGFMLFSELQKARQVSSRYIC
jgi:DNA polymerase theta